MQYRFADRLEGMSGNAIREIFKLLASPEVISFAGGMPAADSFPIEETRRIVDKALQSQGVRMMQYGATEGSPSLVEALIPFLGKLGFTPKREEMLVISGAQQGIDLICKAVLNPGDVVLVESPTYLAALQIMRMYQAKPVAVETDEDGALLEDVEEKLKKHRPKLMYLVPTFQNPTGRTLSLARREKLAALVAKYGTLLVEDDPYRDLRYRGQPVPPVKMFDQDGAVLYLTSFSKIISPGVRVGAAVGSSEVIRKMTLGKQTVDVQCNGIAQGIVEGFLREDLLPAHIERLCAMYCEKKERMQKNIKAFFPKEVACTDPDGGLFIWVRLPGRVNTTALLSTAVSHNVAYVPGETFFADGSVKSAMRLNFSNATFPQIDTGIETLAGVIREAIE